MKAIVNYRGKFVSNITKKEYVYVIDLYNNNKKTATIVFGNS